MALKAHISQINDKLEISYFTQDSFSKFLNLYLLLYYVIMQKLMDSI